jgi:hypothetical protein
VLLCFGPNHKRRKLQDSRLKINGEQHYLWRAVDHEGEGEATSSSTARWSRRVVSTLFGISSGIWQQTEIGSKPTNNPVVGHLGEQDEEVRVGSRSRTHKVGFETAVRLNEINELVRREGWTPVPFPPPPTLFAIVFQSDTLKQGFVKLALLQ